MRGDEVQVCALCGEAIEPEGNILTIYFEINGMGAFELNIHAECLIKLGEPDHLKNGTPCVLCGSQKTNSCFLVRQLDNLSYPVHTNCLENLLEQFASLFKDRSGELGTQGGRIFSGSEEEDQLSNLGLFLCESRN